MCYRCAISQQSGKIRVMQLKLHTRATNDELYGSTCVSEYFPLFKVSTVETKTIYQAIYATTLRYYIF